MIARIQAMAPRSFVMVLMAVTMTVGGGLIGRPLAIEAVPVAAGAAAPMAAAPVGGAGAARVVLIVGPSGAATERYRAESRAAADVARTYTPDVTEIYSPNATWPAVKDALQGASLVIYMGHGNGWPSRYRDALYPATQNGFGVNPTAGGDDDTHRYVGESRIAAEVRLAPNAVVLLHHLCYASGLSEPGLPEGSIEVVRQRIDNFAAGFIAAGAAAVVAEAYAAPDHMIRSVLGSRRSIEASWRRAPSANGNVSAFESARSPGFVALMDPAGRESGFERSIVLRAGLASADVLRGARGLGGGGAGSPGRGGPVVPSLLGSGLRFGDPVLRGTSVAGSATRIRLGYTIDAGARLPDGMTASVRWTALDAVNGEGPGAGNAADVIVAERVGEVTDPVLVSVAGTAIGFDATTPVAPGRYRLDVTLSDPSGVAFDAGTQSLVPGLLVRVTGDVDAAIVIDGPTEATTGAAAVLPVWVTNLGRGAWGVGPGDRRRGLEGGQPAVVPRVVGQWLAVGARDDGHRAAVTAAAAATAVGLLRAGHEAGSTERIEIAMIVPVVAGEYLLVLDIVTPGGGSLIAGGVDPVVVRMTVSAPESPGPRQ